MSRRARRVPRSRANRSRSRPRSGEANRSGAGLAKPDARDTRPLLARILDTPHLAAVVPRLRPEVLHRVIDRCGLEDCGELVTLATPEQLTSVLDLDLWRSDRPGHDECLDPARFGVWLEVLVDSGAAVAARVLAEMDAGLVSAALARHVRIFDVAAISRSPEMDQQIDEVEASRGGSADVGLSCEIGGYLIEARRDDAWHAIVTALASLDGDHPEAFHRVLRECRRLSNSTPEVDGLDDLLTDPEQAMFDVGVDRERRRHAQGYATPAEARAFLQTSRHLFLDQESAPPRDAVAAAYFRTMGETRAADPNGAVSGSPPASAVASLMDVLVAEGVLQQPPRALLEGARSESRPVSFMRSCMQFVHDADPGAYERRSEELAFLANALLAGCSIQARPFTIQEASDAAVAVCNLGLENWPSHWRRSSSRVGSIGVEGLDVTEDFLAHQDLVCVFQVGWHVLYRQVCMYAAEQLVAVLGRVTCADPEIQAGLDVLRRALRKHGQSGEPWRARDALDVIASLDMPAWATLLCLIDECPVIHAALAASQSAGTHSVSASAFEFISANSQIVSVRGFMQSLPETLGG